MDAQVTNIVEQTVLERMQAKASFTALDISNALKADVIPSGTARWRRPSATFWIGRDGCSGFDRQVIDVVTDGGAKKTQAFLYLHTGRANTNTRRRRRRHCRGRPGPGAGPVRLRRRLARAAPAALREQAAADEDAAHRAGPPRRRAGRPAYSGGAARLDGGDVAHLRCENGQMKIAPRPTLTQPLSTSGRGEQKCGCGAGSECASARRNCNWAH